MIKYLILLILVCFTEGTSAASHLDKVIQNKRLNVCTTGDYLPYTLKKADGSYAGIDISMAQSLARSLDAKINWVPVSWKTLMADFQAQRCDIAVGGVSVTLRRQQQVWFSDRLNTDGKIPLVRCTDKQKYQTIEQLNKPGVHLIEPAGGTNEAFVRTHLPRGYLTLFPDNVTIFQQLVDNKADVMITDASEAQFQIRHYPKLCALNPDKPLQYAEKAYMLPRDDISWKLYVDQWLHLSKATGEYRLISSQWITTS